MRVGNRGSKSWSWGSGELPVVFFFFQAEDGIRDYKVTGVQTCALPIWDPEAWSVRRRAWIGAGDWMNDPLEPSLFILDRKSTRLNSSHLVISYAVFCLKKKKKKKK